MKTTNKFNLNLLLITFLALAGLWNACDDVGEDILEAPDEKSEILEFNISLNATNESPGILDLTEIRNHADFSEFNVSADPENGVISFTDDLSKLIYVPNKTFEAGEDGFIITALNNDSEVFLQNAVKVVVESTGNTGTGSGDPFSYGEMSIATDSTFVVDLLDNDLFGDMPYQGSRGVRIIDIANTDGLNISVFPGPNKSSEEAWLTFTPPTGFTGEVEFIYELCFGFEDVNCGDPLLGVFGCDITTVCNYSTSTQAKIIVNP